MASISIHVDGNISIDPMTQNAIDGDWPLSINIESFVGEGEHRHTFHKDNVNIHGTVKDFRSFAEAILAALPAADEAPAPECVTEAV